MNKLALALAVFSFSCLTFAQSQCLGDICIGNVVMDTSNDIGTVQSIEENKLCYKVGNWVGCLPPQSLSPEVTELQGLKNGVSVIDQGNDIGIVKRAFRDGRIQYQVASWVGVTRAQNLTRETNSYLKLSKNIVVIDTSNDIGTVTRLFEDGRIQYKVASWIGITKAALLVPEINSYDGMVVDSVVIDPGNDIGSVLRLFEDGRIQYKVASWIGIEKRLIPEVTEVNGLKKSIVVVDHGNDVGVVNRVFRDGRVQYQVVRWTGIVSANALSKETNSHPLYNKDELYALGSHIGKAIRFFENGKVQLRGVLGNHNEKVGSQLAKEVASLGELTVGAIVKDATMTEGQVQNVFENRAVIYTRDTLKTSAIIVDLAALSSEVKTQYLQDLIFTIKRLENDITVSNYAVLQSHEEELKKILLVHLKANESTLVMSGMTKEVKKKLMEYLETVTGGTSEEQVPTPVPNGQPETGVLSVSLDNAQFNKLVDDFFTKKGIKHIMTNGEAVGDKTLTIKVMALKKGIIASCDIAAQLRIIETWGSQAQGIAIRRTKVSLSKKPCDKKLKSILEDLEIHN